jgi:hypothetical protein
LIDYYGTNKNDGECKTELPLKFLKKDGNIYFSPGVETWKMARESAFSQTALYKKCRKILVKSGLKNPVIKAGEGAKETYYHPILVFLYLQFRGEAMSTHMRSYPELKNFLKNFIFGQQIHLPVDVWLPNLVTNPDLCSYALFKAVNDRCNYSYLWSVKADYIKLRDKFFSDRRSEESERFKLHYYNQVIQHVKIFGYALGPNMVYNYHTDDELKYCTVYELSNSNHNKLVV